MQSRVAVLELWWLVVFVDLADQAVIGGLGVHWEVREVCDDAEVDVTVVGVPSVWSQVEDGRAEGDVGERHELVLMSFHRGE